MNIKAHFDDVKKKHEELVAKAKSEKEKIQKAITLKEKDQYKLEAEKVKNEMLLGEDEEVVNVPKLKANIQELDSQIKQIIGDLSGLQEKESDGIAFRTPTFEREDQMVSILKNVYQCEEAAEVNGLEECFKVLPVEVTKHDGAGQAEQCTISIGPKQIVLNIKTSGKRFLKNFRPEPLKWLPATDVSKNSKKLRGSHHDNLACVYFDRKTEKLILLQKLKWRQEVKQREYPYNTESKHFDDEFADIAIQLDSKIDEFLTKENNELNLEKSYKDNPLLAHARDEVMAQTSSKPLFKESGEKLSSPEIYKRIKTEWDSFVNCPWSSEINGTLALLKYHSENGEKARFWSGDFEGQYGFRLRTRDHSWIVGGVYISPSTDADSKCASLKMVHHENYSQSVGRMFLTVSMERDRDARH